MGVYNFKNKNRGVGVTSNNTHTTLSTRLGEKKNAIEVFCSSNYCTESI